MSTAEERKVLLQEVEHERQSKAILYVTGDRQGLETKIGQDIIDLFVDHLDALGPTNKISMILVTSGGDVSAAWNLVNLLHMFCDDFEVIAPGKCMSAGTLISLGADRIVMTKQATLGPIDPSIQHQLGPSIPGANPEARAGVSVEAVNGYLDAIRNCKDGSTLECQALLDLSNKVHPLVLGQIFRSRQQIRDLAEKLLNKHTEDAHKRNRIIDFLCSDSGSHDYTINRREARSLGLNVENCTNTLYRILGELRNSYSSHMELRTPFDINAFANLQERKIYDFTRAIIESVGFGAHRFVSRGHVEPVAIDQRHPDGSVVTQKAMHDQREFEGWEELK